MSHRSPSEGEQPRGHRRRLGSLIQCIRNLYTRYKQLGGIDDLNEAIVLDREALSLCPIGHPNRPSFLDYLAIRLSSRYQRLGEIDDLDEALVLDREALSLRPPGHPRRLLSSNNLADHLFLRYKQLGEINDLNEALDLDQETLSLRPPGHLHRLLSLNNRATRLSSRYNLLGNIDDLNEAIVLVREALSLRSPRHPHYSMSLNNLANHLSSRYNLLGGIDDLDEAIVLACEALSLRPPGHPYRLTSLNNLAKRLSSRYNVLGGVDDLNMAIVLIREALLLRSPGHPHRPMSLNNLASRLSSRYNLLGGIDDLNEAIVLDREALSLRPHGHAHRSMSLINLVNHLSSRYKLLEGVDDLNEAIILAREALSLRPLGDPYRSIPLNSLANRLSFRYKLLGRTDDLDEALVLDREALSLRPPGHPDRSSSLNNLANHLFSRYILLRGIDDLNEALVLDREALSLRLPGHPCRSSSLNNLANCLFSRYKLLGNSDDLDEALVLDWEALSLRPPGHPDRSLSLNNLAHRLSSRHNLLEEIGGIDAAIEDKQELFSLYTELENVSQTVSSADLHAAKAWVETAEKFHHPTTLSAYETALRLIVEHVAILPPLPRHLGLLKSLLSSLAVDAFSACLRNGSPAKAVELLEQGRAVFWSLLNRLRSPLHDITVSGLQGKALAGEFTRLASLVHETLNSPGPDQHDRVCCLNLELRKVVHEIRELPGFSRFLLPLLFSDLRWAAKDGPVVIMNASKYSCDALIMFSDKDPIHIPLPVTKGDVRNLLLQLRALTTAARWTRDMKKEFRIFLRELWDKLVSPIMDVLQAICPHNSRIWWCPTAEFSLLPLHAANPYRKGQKGISDLYVSSYTTTLTALIHARRPSSSDSVHEKRHFIAIGQAAAKGASGLLSVDTELDNIGHLVQSLATFTRVEAEGSCTSAVAEELGKNEWVHFACHGIPNQEQPFESAFALHDGGFTIQHIIQCNLQNPEFAYLSACYTTVGDQESPDEVIHLASAMQFAGFRSVIGTMGAVDDAETNKVTSMFYALMKDESGHLDYTRAARALRMAMSKVDIPMDQRILYIHLGA